MGRGRLDKWLEMPEGRAVLELGPRRSADMWMRTKFPDADSDGVGARRASRRVLSD